MWLTKVRIRVLAKVCLGALSLWAGALAMWRAYVSSSGFDPVWSTKYVDTLVDSLLSVAAAQSPFYVSGEPLRAELRSVHEVRVFDRICVVLVSTL